MVTRYELDEGDDETSPRLIESRQGEWVSFGDYETLLDELQSIKKAVDKALDYLNTAV